MARTKSNGEDNLLNEALSPEEELAELKAQLEHEKAKTAKLQDMVDKRKGMMPGWIISCPNIAFNGKTAGVRFNNGIGFIPGEDESYAKYLCDDFGYTRRFVENYLEEPSIAKEVGNSLSELMMPQHVR